MNNLVKIIAIEGGEYVKRAEQKWCVSVTTAGEPAVLCSGDFYTDGCEYYTKQTKRGGISCPRCIEKLKEIKSIKL